MTQLLPNLVIMFEAFKRSQNLKTWLCLQSMRGTGILASYCIRIQLLLCGAERYKYSTLAISSQNNTRNNVRWSEIQKISGRGGHGECEARGT